MPQTWDERGDLVPPQSWDEQGNPIGGAAPPVKPDVLTQQTARATAGGGASMRATGAVLPAIGSQGGATPYGFDPSHMAVQAGTGLKELAGGALDMGAGLLTHPIDTVKHGIIAPMNAEWDKARTAPTMSEAVGHGLASLLPMVGPFAANLGEQAGTGDVGGALARGGIQMGATEALPRVLPKALEAVTGIPDIKEAIGRAVRNEPSIADTTQKGTIGRRTPVSSLKPGVKLVSNLIGAVTGGALGSVMGSGAGEGFGVLGGWNAGPEIASTILPRHPNEIGEWRPLKNVKVPKTAGIEPSPSGIELTDGEVPDGQDLISRMNKISVPGEVPDAGDLKRAGDFTQAPLGRLKVLAKFGDRLAQKELGRRLKN